MELLWLDMDAATQIRPKRKGAPTPIMPRLSIESQKTGVE